MQPAASPHDFLRFLESPEVMALRAGFMSRRCRRGETLCGPGTTRDEVLVLRRGRVRVHTSDGRRELTLMFLEPGDVFSTHTGATLTAAGAVELLAMPTRHFAQAQEAGGTPAVVSIMRVLAHLDRRRTGSDAQAARLIDYIDRQRASTQGAQRDDLLLHSLVNSIRELFERHADTLALDDLDRLERECF